MLPPSLRGPLTLALVGTTIASALVSAYQVYSASCTQEFLALRAVRAYEGFTAKEVANEIGEVLEGGGAALGDSVRAAASRAVATLVVPSPASLVTADSLVAVTVSGPSGGIVFQSGGRRASRQERPLAASIFMNGVPTGYTVRAELRPWVKSALTAGMWSWNRAQFVIALITLTAGLIVVTLFQLRRERALTRVRADFVANVSHELRTPLAQIRMFAEMLRLGWVRSEAERTRSVEVIDQEARRLSNLVENILRFSAAERTGTRVVPREMELGAFTEETIEAFEPLARARGATVQHVRSSPAWVLADRDALCQILVNLLDNAVKYGPPGQIVLVGTDAPANGHVRLWVADEGPGIPVRERRRVFEPFARLDRSAERTTTGSGIGLAVVRAITEAHGGLASIEEGAGGRGTRVVIALPAVMPAAERPRIQSTVVPEMAGAGAPA